MSTQLSEELIAISLQQNLQSVLDGMPVAVSWANLNNQHISYVNKKFINIFGYQLEDHKTVGDWIKSAYINPAQVKRAVGMWSSHFEAMSIVPIEIEAVEVDVMCKDGSIKTTLHGGMILPSHQWALATFIDITDRKEQELRTEKLAMEDDLTGIANRRAFRKILSNCLSNAKRQGKYTALILLDLDNFKTLNDTKGHDCGDLALQIVAQRMEQGIRGKDYACRLGGDEFAIVIDCVDTLETIEDIANRLLVDVSKMADLNGTPISIGVSAGVGVYPLDATDGKELYKFADEALYRSKNGGRGKWSR